MKAIAVYPGKENSVHLRSVEKPIISKNQVLVKTIRVGIDGTDREINLGLYGKPPKNDNFLIIGHEALGRIEKVGSEIKSLKEGDLVVPVVRRPCLAKTCPTCSTLEYDMCYTGKYKERGIIGLHGYLSQYFVEEEQFLVKVPPEIKETAVLTEPLSILEKTFAHAYKMQERFAWKPDVAMVMGAGPIGLFATLIARHKNLETYTLDIREQDDLRVKLVKESGSNYINSRERDFQEISNNIGKNIDFIIEATGNSHVVIQSMSILGSNGILGLVGITAGEKTFGVCADCLNLQIVLGNKVIFGSVSSNKTHFQSAVRHLVELESRWPKLLSKFITKRYKVDDYSDAFKDTSKNIKVVLEFRV